MLRPEKVAKPLEALCELPPLRVPLPGFVPIAKLMVAVELGIKLLFESWTWTVMAGEMLSVAVAFEGWLMKANLLADPGVMLKALLSAEVRPAEEARRV